MQRLDGQVAIVTGGARGIGFGIASVLHAEGATVVLADLDEAAATDAAASLGPGNPVAVPMNVSEHASVTAGVAWTADRFGRIDIAIANAGVYPHIDLAEITPQQWDSVMAINVRGAMLVVQACLPHMISRGYGRMVLSSSITGSVVGQPGYAHYGASKAALVGFMRSAALEVATAGVTINAVLPGNIQTQGFSELGPAHEAGMLAAIPMGYLGKPEDVGWAVRYLASPEARYITGQTLVIDGGQVLPESR